MGNSEAKQKKKEEEQLKKLEETEKKIGTAVFFLQGENMEKIPVMEKKIFLRKKGLTEEMVEEAFKRFEEKKAEKKGSQTEPLAKIETIPTTNHSATCPHEKAQNQNNKNEKK